MDGNLFSQDFLFDGIKTTQLWLETTAASFIAELRAIYAPLTAASQLNEANTESDLIIKVLDLLDWRDLTLRQITASSKRRDDVPDFLLFASDAAKRAARDEKREDLRYRHGVAILEAKRWLRPLDRGANRLDPGTPSNQILRYLSSVEVASERKIRWGILTNGAVWRLYWQGARSRSEEFFEINLAELLGVTSAATTLAAEEVLHGFKLFLCLFQRSAFLIQPWDREERTFHEYALHEARLYEAKVSQDLGARVFDTIFPQLADAIAAGDPQAQRDSARYLNELREATLVLLYRLLFILYAEDRNLLPVQDQRYDDYSLRKIRLEIAARRDAHHILSASAGRYWQHLIDLFRIIALGDSSIGMPAYNGGLFEEARALLLTRVRIADARFAPLLDELARRVDQTATRQVWINYRDLSVQQLGSIYERLLEYQLVVEGQHIVTRPASFARKTSGSYYTHDGLVKLIISETIGPLVAEGKTKFFAQINDWQPRRELTPSEWAALDHNDPASKILELKICDPAMGSGHFLVSLVDYLADEILETIANTETEIARQQWAQPETPWVSPLVARIAAIRSRILTAARHGNWTINAAQLDDRHLVRRMILKRVIYGVDLNPMAVELAKVALWLHTFTVGAPLSFLDHHLRCGDALFGGKVRDISRELAKLKGSLLQQGDLTKVAAASMNMETIGSLTDIDIAEAHRSKAIMDQITDSLKPLWQTLDFLQAQRWANKAANKDYQTAWASLLNQEYADNLLDALALLSKATIKLFNERQRASHATVQHALQFAARHRFLHWELAFPTVWQNGSGGFDAVIGNPPWEKLQFEEVEWFAERRTDIAKATRGADRKKLIANLQAKADPLWQDFSEARESAEAASRVARDYGDYPLLSKGIINLYALFVERASALIQPHGVVGLLCPTGIAADKGASAFFRSISSTGRLATLYDFDNRKALFPDIDSRFKFCILIFGGNNRVTTATRCAFYLHYPEELKESENILHLNAADFCIVNPNTGTAAIFRSQRDADITIAIYRRQPVLVDRSTDTIHKVWQVRYHQMFNMTNASQLFKRSDELENEGWYPVGMNHWKKGDAEAVPLYVGKMVYHYDHRAADVAVNQHNLKVASLADKTTSEQKTDPNFYPTPQYWIESSAVTPTNWREWTIGFRDITNATNARTMIAAIIPTVTAGHKLPLLLPDESTTAAEYAQFAPLLLANLNSMALDFIARQKVQSTNMTWYTVEQLPLIRAEQFTQTLGKIKISDYIRGEVLRLSYTAHDLAPFARDLGYEGAPFRWDEIDRRHRLARLDALFFHLYGLNRDEVAYILDTFPIVREQDEKTHHGVYLTKKLILAYLNAVRAGDFTSIIK